MTRTLSSSGVVLFVLCLSLSIATPAFAETIVLNPGPVGKTPPTLIVPFSPFIGTPLAGQTLSLTTMFSEEKWIFVTSSFPEPFVFVKLQTNHTGFWPVTDGVPGFGQLLDIDGTPFTDPIPLIYPSGNSDGGALYAYLSTGTIPTPYRFFGLHHEFTLPNMSGINITAGSQLVVGWSDSISVSELPSAWLLSIGLVVFGTFRRCAANRFNR